MRILEVTIDCNNGRLTKKAMVMPEMILIVVVIEVHDSHVKK